ncbi:MAG: shikimate kinase [Proteobacteria bacterium]|nr:shikimate kinase [Pseudomonadota bacterium]MBU1647898.1 shikimate kinase [Pseudomonadota bacterium]MBU1986501.1 shikimate kinase [Pseudomonadota bacterium]
MSAQKTNLVLIGMAGAGKSTVGPLLARILSYGFVDVDELIEADQQQSLQELVDQHGAAWFRLLEERILLGLDLQRHVIATGGSAVYGAAGMKHLQQSGLVVYLDVPLAVLEARVGDVATRGLAREEGQSFAQLFADRQPLYLSHADIRIECGGKSLAEICAAIIQAGAGLLGGIP